MHGTPRHDMQRFSELVAARVSEAMAERDAKEDLTVRALDSFDEKRASYQAWASDLRGAAAGTPAADRVEQVLKHTDRVFG